MRSHGVPNFPDPIPDGDLSLERNSGINPQSPSFQAAQTACSKFQPGGPGSFPRSPRRRGGRRCSFAQCMRAHGEPNFPDPALTRRRRGVRARSPRHVVCVRTAGRPPVARVQAARSGVRARAAHEACMAAPRRRWRARLRDWRLLPAGLGTPKASPNSLGVRVWRSACVRMGCPTSPTRERAPAAVASRYRRHSGSFDGGQVDGVTFSGPASTAASRPAAIWTRGTSPRASPSAEAAHVRQGAVHRGRTGFRTFPDPVVPGRRGGSRHSGPQAPDGRQDRPPPTPPCLRSPCERSGDV